MALTTVLTEKNIDSFSREITKNKLLRRIDLLIHFKVLFNAPKMPGRLDLFPLLIIPPCIKKLKQMENNHQLTN